MRRLVNLIQNHKNWLSYLIYKFTRYGKSDFVFRTRSGMNIQVPGRLLHTYKECFLDETYLKGLTKKIAKKHPVIIDIGANVGYFSLSMFSHFPGAMIIAIEPMPNNFSLLTKYKNSFSGFDFIILNQAVAKESGELEIHYNANDSYTTSATIFDHTGQDSVIKVPSIQLKEVVENYKLEEIDLLKLDCEGAEYEILYNLDADTWNKVKALSIETHKGNRDGESQSELRLFIKKKGFTTFVKGSKIWAERE